MKWEDLVPVCIEVLLAYNPVTDSPDSHISRLLGGLTSTELRPSALSVKLQKAEPNELSFIQQVFYGCYRHRNFLKALVKTLMTVNARSTNSADTYPFTVISYLALFRLDELGVKNFRKLVDTQQPLKMHTLLSFLFNLVSIQEHVRPLWVKIYDFHFVDTEVIQKINDYLPEVQPLLSYLQMKAAIVPSESVSEEEVREKKVTAFEPFNITQPKPKPPPPPPEVYETAHANPINREIFAYSLKDIEAEKAAAREANLSRRKSMYEKKFARDPIKRLFDRA
mmetsp:Transcript_11164/g.21956  ORF Transcript_11164/g.21956 Transcript_11164/m.21956 type:complete len:281 (-) Transcript_11164:54-896(-)